MALFGIAAALGGHPAATFLLGRVVTLASGYDVSFGDQRLSWSHAVLSDVHVRAHGEPLLDARRIDLDYDLRGFLPGSSRRYGFVSAVVDAPVITLIRHADGSYNVAFAGQASSGAGGAPLRFNARVFDGAIRLVDRAPIQADLAEQSIVDVSVDAAVDSATRTTAFVEGEWVGRRTRGAPEQRWPISVRSTVDEVRGYAIQRVRATSLPIRGALGFLLHSPVARFDDGMLHDVDVMAYDLDVIPGEPIAYRLGGGADLEGARLSVGPLAEPIRDLGGRIDLFDDGVATPGLTGSLAGIPLRARGGFYDFRRPRLRVGVAADGDLASLRAAFHFTATQPIRGPTHLETMITSRVDTMLIRTAFSSPLLQYGTIAIDRAGAYIDYADNAVSISGGHGQFGPIATALDGEVVTDDPHTPMRFLLRADGPAGAIPYAQTVAAGEQLEATTIIAGTGDGGFHVGGTFGTAGPDGTGVGFVAVDEHGVGEFGPFAFSRSDGSELVGGLRLDRPASLSAGWLAANGYRLDIPSAPAALPGVTIPGFPPLGGRLDAAIVGGGPSSDFRVAGTIRATGVRYATYGLGAVTAELGGTLADLRFSRIATDGPLGRFRGDAAYADETLALRGQYDGPLQRLESFTGAIGAAGTIHAPFAALLGPRQLVVQSSGATLHDGSVRGIELDRAAATLAIEGSGVRVVAADAELAGARIVAAARAPGAVAVSAVGIPARALRGTGIPLTAGSLTLFGVADLRVPQFRGVLDLAGGLADGYSVQGWADVNYARASVEVTQGIGAVGATYGTIGGRLDGVTSGVPHYRLAVSIPQGDAATLVRSLRLPISRLAGSYDATLAVEGVGAAPQIHGTVVVPEANFHGVAVHDASAAVALTSVAPLAVRFDEGRAAFGATDATFSAALTGNRMSLRAASSEADLSDIDGYFDRSDMVAGRGSFDVALATDGKTTSSSGTVGLSGARFGRFPFGTVAARWSSQGQTIGGQASLSDPAGRLVASGTIAPGAGPLLEALRSARFDMNVSLADLDLGTWLPAAGYRVPILGRIDGTGHLSGAFPHLAADATATLRDGFVGTIPVVSAGARLRYADQQLALQNASADLGVLRLDASGSVALGPRGPFDLHVHAIAPDVAAAARAVFPSAAIPLSGSAEVDTVLTGTPADPHLTAGIDLENARYASLAIPRALASFESNLRTLQLDSAQIDLQHGTAFVAGTLPLELDPAGIGPPSAPLSLTLEAQGIDLAPFGAFVPAGGATLAGTVDGRLALEGTAGSPHVLGSFALHDGSFVSRLESAPIRNVDAALQFNGTTVALQSLSADVGGGSLTASGELDLPVPGAPHSGYAIAVSARGARLTFPAYGGGQFDGSAKITSGEHVPTLSGDVTLSNATIPFAAIYRAAGGAAVANAPPLDLGFDLASHIGTNVRIHSANIDVGATGDLNLTGTLRAPQLSGTLTATRGGFFSDYQRAFRIQDATVHFDPSDGIVPTIDLHATAHVTDPDPDPDRNPIGSANITVAVAGPADRFTTTFSSDPPYPQAQILGLLVDAQLFGAVNFNAASPVGLLPGAPGESNVLDPPGVTPYLSGSYGLPQEVFSLLNAQVTQHVLAPLERATGNALDLDDVGLTVDYGARLGYTASRTIDPRTHLSATVGQILSYPTQTQFGFASTPDAATSASFTYFTQSASPEVILASASTADRTLILNGIQPYSNRQGFRFNITRRYP